MTREESIKLLAIIKVAYPSAYRDMDKENKLATVNMWQMSFYDVPYILMEMAINNYRMKNKFAPTIAEITEELKHIYFIALEDVLSPLSSHDIRSRAYWITKHTDRFAHPQHNTSIPYSSISDAMLTSGNKGGHMLEEKTVQT